MIQIRRASERGHAQHGWLDSYHTFSFANYYDPAHMGYRALRVINEDFIEPGMGFGKHPHNDMEIITYVLEGELEHQDSLGSGSVIRPGVVQRMSAGKGIIHSEFNHSKKNRVHLLQIWIHPNEFGIKPSYEEKEFPSEGRKNRLQLVVSPDGAESSIRIHQDARLYAGVLQSKHEIRHPFSAGRFGWLQVARGELELNDQKLQAGDGAAIEEERIIKLVAPKSAEILLFDLP